VSYDVTILGAGPAGSAAALALKRLRPTLRVLIVEPSRNDLWRVGETLSPGCETILKNLGCRDTFREAHFIESFGTRSSWGSDHVAENDFIFSTGGNGWHIDRKRFEQLLSKATSQAGTEVWHGWRVTASALSDDGWQLTVSGTAGKREVETQFVIDATGRSASFALQQGAYKIASDRLVGVAARFDFSGCGVAIDPRTLVEAREEGWWYSALTPDCRMVVAWMSDADLVREGSLHTPSRWLERLHKSPLTAARVAKARFEPPLRILAAQSQILSSIGGARWLATGDAATGVDPLSSQGILKALCTGKLAAFAAFDCLAGRLAAQSRYEKLVIGDYERYKEIKSSFYSLELRWRESPFWARRHAA
jgi:flavin-dependent dehydrogenase